MLTPRAFLIVCPILFLAGFIDSVGGGGGLLSLPAFMLVGLPYPIATGCNKLSCFFGIALSTGRFLKKGFLNLKLAIPTIFLAIAGSALGAKFMLVMDNAFMESLMLFLIPISAIVVLMPGTFRSAPKWEGKPNRKVWLSTMAVALVMGFYCGFYGPGSGTLMILAFTIFSGMTTPQANAHAKVINLTSIITALSVLLKETTLPLLLCAACAVCHMLGSYIGSGLAMKNNAKVTRPILLLVLALLYLKIMGIF